MTLGFLQEKGQVLRPLQKTTRITDHSLLDLAVKDHFQEAKAKIPNNEEAKMLNQLDSLVIDPRE